MLSSRVMTGGRTELQERLRLMLANLLKSQIAVLSATRIRPIFIALAGFLYLPTPLCSRRMPAPIGMG